MVKEKPRPAERLSPIVEWIASIHESIHHHAVGFRTLSLRWYLVSLVAGTLVPAVLFTGAVVYRLSTEVQESSNRRMLREARNLSVMVEREFSSTTRTLQALGASEQLYEGDLEGFYNEAKRLKETQTSWLAAILLSPDGQQLINSRQPFEEPLPRAMELASFEKLIATRKPVIGNLGQNLWETPLAFPIRVPVMREDDLQYILTAIITPETLANAMSEQLPVEGEWTRTVVDGQGVVVARTLNPQRFVGQRGTPSFLQRINESSEGVYRDTTLEGMRVYVAFSRVGNTSWTAAVTVPVDVIHEPSRRAMGLVVGSGLVLLVVSSLGAFLLARQISRSISSAALAAEALVNDEYPQVNSRSIREIALLGQSLELAAKLLLQREQERTENLMHAEAAKEEAETANRIKDEFLAVLSHELRTPLNPILGWASLLRSGNLNTEKTAFALETIERNAKLQTQLIEDLLDVTRIMQGKVILNKVPVQLKSVIEAAIETVRLTAEKKSIKIKTNFDPTVGKVLGDTTRLQQIIWNLLSNAVKFTDAGGQIIVGLQQVDSQAQIQITDTGKGIHASFLPHVFEYFRQEDGTTTRKFGGLGLGLAIVRHLVELHGGTVQADSQGEGQGATFRVSLPLLG